MSLLALCAFFPGYASAQSQSPCHPLRERMYGITSTQAAQVSDSLHVVLDLAASFRDCEQKIPVDIELWLLTAEVLAHDGLQQYDEADSLVTRFTMP